MLTVMVSSDSYPALIAPITVNINVEVLCDSLQTSWVTPPSWWPAAFGETMSHFISFTQCGTPTTDVTLKFFDAASQEELGWVSHNLASFGQIDLAPTIQEFGDYESALMNV